MAFLLLTFITITTLLCWTLTGNVELLFEQTTLLHERIVQDLRQNPAGSRPEVERVCKFYGDCQQEVSDALAARQQSYDLPIIYLAAFALLMVLHVCILSSPAWCH